MAGSAPLQAQALSIDPFVRDFCLYVKYVKKKKRFKMPSFWTETHEPVGRKWGCLFDTVLLVRRAGLKSSTVSFLEGRQWDAWRHSKEQHVKTKIRVGKMAPGLMRHPFPFSHFILFSEECYIKHATTTHGVLKGFFPDSWKLGNPLSFTCWPVLTAIR